jgi:hypothetical protein
MKQEYKQLLALVLEKIQHANDLIVTLKNYLDVREHKRLVAALTKDYLKLKNSDSLSGEDAFPYLMDVNNVLWDLCEHMKRSICNMRYNEAIFEAISEYLPSRIDTIIKNIPFPKLQVYTCPQGKLIDKIWTFCNSETENNSRIFNLFTEDDLGRKWHEIWSIKKGLCLGLGALFLLCSFISDRQQYKKVTEPEDDLRWFYRCMILLQLRHYNYSIEQKRDLTRFISLVIHLQNDVQAPGVSNNLLRGGIDPTFKQLTAIINAEFNGDHCIEYEYPSIESEDFINTILTTSDCLYINFILVNNNRNIPGHSVTLHKNSSGGFIYFDPSHKAIEVQLKSKKDYRLFEQSYFDDYDKIYVVMGKSSARRADTTLSSPESPKKRLRILN